MFDDMRDKEEYIRALTNNIPAAIFRDKYLGGDDWRLEYASGQIEAITGIAAADFIHRDQRSYIQMTHADDAAMVKAARRNAIAASSGYSLEYRLIDASGAVRWVAENGQANIDVGSRSQYLDGLLSDISARKKTESILVESDKRYRAFVESTESIVVYLDPRGLILEFNPAAEALYGMRRQDVLGKNYFKLFLPEEIHEAVAADMKKVLAGTPTRGFENEVVTHAKIRRVLSWYVIRTLDINGEPSGIVASGHDITSRKLAEEALQESRKMLQLVLDSIPVRVAWKDRNQIYLGCNSLFARDAGLDTQYDIVGRTDYELSDDREQAEMYRADDKEVMDSGMAKLNHEARHSLPGGKNVWFSANRVPLTDLKNNIIGMLSTYEDITDRRKAELQAAARNLRLKRLTELSLTLSG
ncbi:MAG: PAS domain S-box protein, partial [Pseudomonadota bacterium]